MYDVMVTRVLGLALCFFGDPSMDLPFDRSIWPAVVRELEFCPQQAKVVELLMQGMGDRQIALSLDLSESTVRTYLGRIFARLGIQSRIELILRVVAVAWRHRK